MLYYTATGGEIERSDTMSLFDSVKGFASDMVTQSKENHVKVTLISGKKCFYLGPLENSVVIRQNDAGFIYFDDIDGTYKIAGYEWGGPEYQEVTKTTGTTSTSGTTHSKGREKRTGRLTGAAVGSLFGPGGAVIGAMVGTGNKKIKGKEKNRSLSTLSSRTTSYEQETDSVAYMTLTDPATQYTFSFGFKCNSKIHGEILNMLHESSL